MSFNKHFLQFSTGINLRIPEKRGKRKKNDTTDNLTHKKMKTSSAALKIIKAKNLPGLLDVVKKQNNTYTRLAKKIFNRFVFGSSWLLGRGILF